MSHHALYAGIELQRALSAYFERVAAMLPRFPGGFAELCEVIARECDSLSHGGAEPEGTLVSTRMLRLHVERLARNEATRTTMGSGVRCDNVEEFRRFLDQAGAIVTRVTRERAFDRLDAMMAAFYESLADFCRRMSAQNPTLFPRKVHLARLEEFLPSDEERRIPGIESQAGEPSTPTPWPREAPAPRAEPSGDTNQIAADTDASLHLEATLHDSDLETFVRSDLRAPRTPAPDDSTPPRNGRASASTPPPASPNGRSPAHITGIRAEEIRPGVAREVLARQRPEWIGRRLGRYELTAFLGGGASSQVYLSRHPLLDLPVAIKILHDASNEMCRRRLESFFQEARLSVKINHPNAVRTFDLDEQDGIPFIVMEYVEGKTVKELIVRGEAFTEERALVMTRSIALVLQAAYEQRIIHRDIKPDNLIITPVGDVKVSDLGLAKIARYESAEDTAIVGTPLYIAPEAIMNPGLVDFRGDIYSLGATLYHLLTGRAPFEGDTMQDLFEAHLHHFLADPRKHRKDLSPGIAALLMHMMEKRPERRHENYAKLLAEVDMLHEFAAGGKPRKRFTTSIVERLKSRRSP